MQKNCCSIFSSTIFRKVIIAITGILMIAFLFVHMLGNLQVFAGAGLTPETTKLNEYAAFLKKEAFVLWGSRIGLLLVIFTHVWATISLTRHNKQARPQSYALRNSYATFASKMMFYGGLTIFFYVIYHILHFTTGQMHPELFISHDVYHNVTVSFQNPLIVAVYVIAQLALYAHLYHGTVSLFQTLGFHRPKHLQMAKVFGIALATIICAGFIIVPIGVFAGFAS